MYFTNGDHRAFESLMRDKPGNSMTAELTALIQSAGVAAVIVLSGHTAFACTRSVPLPPDA